MTPMRVLVLGSAELWTIDVTERIIFIIVDSLSQPFSLRVANSSTQLLTKPHDLLGLAVGQEQGVTQSDVIYGTSAGVLVLINNI